MIKQYFFNILLWIDEGLNVFTGGDPGERVSSRAGKAQIKGKRWACILCRFLDLFEKDHCRKSIDSSDGDLAVIPD